SSKPRTGANSKAGIVVSRAQADKPAKSRPHARPAAPPRTAPGFTFRNVYSIPRTTQATINPAAAAQIQLYSSALENRARPSTRQRTTSVARSTILPPPFTIGSSYHRPCQNNIQRKENT